uniref:Poly [ADP-ribose] polymerase n=1 Tax=Malurus cyaneus samueli TaxID=2593467 RepID=A0A8C5TQT6_9PASS
SYMLKINYDFTNSTWVKTFSALSSTSAHDVHEVTIGSIVFRIVEGDITKEEADVIVNITNQTFSLKIGVSRAILTGAGKTVEDECAILALQTNSNYITTQAGNLPCKKIIHFVAQNDIKFLVSQVLQECELQQYTSVAFPAIGTGLHLSFKIVELKPESREYKDVQAKFLRTCQSFKIEKIERIQNPYFWKAYQIKKCEMDKKNGSIKNERLLFHGTSKESLILINDRGFNRSYAGMHAANFGNGTYFAVNANYSAHDTYSKPDANGKKYMYLARVLVGEYSQGIKGSITPASKNAGNSVDLFDSSTDNMTHPSMFVIFNDIQAYPEYLITFTR